jgi:hypothetical protein
VFGIKCPYCGAELKCIDYYGKKKYADHYYIYPQSWIEKTGDIFQCPNSGGFEEDDTECCESEMFNGYFYTDISGNLREGYPC